MLSKTMSISGLLHYGSVTQSIDIVKTFYEYISNPILLWNGIVEISFWLCLMLTTASLLAYLMTDDKKDINRVKSFFAIWIIIKLLDMSIRRY